MLVVVRECQCQVAGTQGRGTPEVGSLGPEPGTVDRTWLRSGTLEIVHHSGVGMTVDRK